MKNNNLVSTRIFTGAAIEFFIGIKVMLWLLGYTRSQFLP
ncbi:hypothetical protein APA_3786 [Pseudanabaena sp. lw0831]|nr:hypothetical protein APA_3786 [Pseudanabaena sp. lw0831]